MFAAQSNASKELIEEMCAEDLDRRYAVNLRAMMLLSAEVVRSFPAGGSGRTINLTSGQGLGPLPVLGLARTTLPPPAPFCGALFGV